MNSKTLITQEQIAEKIKVLATQIAKKHLGKELILVGVLDGSYILMADLSREIFKQGLEDIEISFIGVSSYASARESSRNPRITKDLNIDIRGRNVLIVEDIVDTGWSLDFLTRVLNERQPASLKTFVLVSKPSRREVEVKLDYVGFEVPNKWVEGYGLDTNYKGRPNPEIIQRS